MNRRGLSLVEMLVTVGISSLIILGGSSVLLQSTKSAVEGEQTLWLEVRQREMRGILRSEAGWAQLLLDNPAMSCLTIACPGNAGPNPLRLRVETVPVTILDGNVPTTGMTRDGNFCNTFDPVAGNPDCPIGLSLTWDPLCDDANCRYPQPRVSIDFSRKIASQPLEPMTAYDIAMFRDPRLDSISQVCASMGGAFTPPDDCSLPVLNTCNVAGGEYVLGFLPDGRAACGVPPIGQCPAGNVLTGFNPDGSINNPTDFCDATPCPP